MQSKPGPKPESLIHQLVCTHCCLEFWDIWGQKTPHTLNNCSPMGLLRAVFFYNGKVFCLRGGQVHRCLKLSQLEWLHNPERYLYRKNSSKNRKGGLSEMRLEHKAVTSIANPYVGVWCHVSLLDCMLANYHWKLLRKIFFIADRYHLYLLTPASCGILPFRLGEILLQRWSHRCVKKQA